MTLNKVSHEGNIMQINGLRLQFLVAVKCFPAKGNPSHATAVVCFYFAEVIGGVVPVRIKVRLMCIGMYLTTTMVRDYFRSFATTIIATIEIGIHP